MQHVLPARKQSAGFTLIELLVVIAIIGLLASTVLASLGSVRATARDTQRLQEARQLINALELYRNQNGRYPCSGASINCSNSTTGGATAATLKNNTGTYSGMPATLRSTLQFAPGVDAFSSAGIIYRVRSTSGNNDGADTSSYTILVRQEALSGTYCEINVGLGHTGYTYADTCPVNTIR